MHGSLDVPILLLRFASPPSLVEPTEFAYQAVVSLLGGSAIGDACCRFVVPLAFIRCIEFAHGPQLRENEHLQAHHLHLAAQIITISQFHSDHTQSEKVAKVRVRGRHDSRRTDVFPDALTRSHPIPSIHCTPRLPYHPAAACLSLPLPRGSPKQHPIRSTRKIFRCKILELHGYVTCHWSG